jgi:hypothetical protein
MLQTAGANRMSLRTPGIAIILTTNVDIVTVDLHASQVSPTSVAPNRTPC